MPEFDESVYDAMSDEELADYLAHDAELPLSFVRSADAVLYAATVLAARQAESLPEAAAALESFRSDYLPVPFDGCTLWDDPPRYAPAAAAPKARPEPPRPAAPAAKPKKQPAAKRSPRPAPIPAPPPPITGSAVPSAPQAPQSYVPAPARAPRRSFAAGLLVAALLFLLVGAGFLYLRTTFRSTLGSSPSPTASAAAAAGLTLTWVPDGYSATQFTDWDVSGYLTTWQNAAGDKITFSRYAGGTKVAVDKSNAETSLVAVDGVQGEYTQKNGERSLVFSDAGGTNVYYLDAKNVSEGDMQKMIAAIK